MGKLKNAAFELDCVRGGLLTHGELLENIHTELAHLVEDVEGMQPQQATLQLHEIKRKLRLLNTLMLHAKNRFQEDFTDLNEATNLILGEDLQSLPEKDVKDQVPAELYQAFCQKQGREPISVEELNAWGTELLSKIGGSMNTKKA